MKKTRLTATDLLQLIDNQWADTKDVMAIGHIGKNQALDIKKIIKTDLEEKGYSLPKNLLPMPAVIEYFKIDVNFLKRVSNLVR